MTKPKGFITPEYVTTSDFRGGLNLSAPADHIQDTEFQEVKNLCYLNGVLQVDTGYVPYGYRVAGNPLGVGQFQLTTGVYISWLITTVAFYTWEDAIHDWVIAGTPRKTTTSTAYSERPWSVDWSGDFGPWYVYGPSITVADLSSVLVGDVVSIRCTNGRYYTSTVVSVNYGTNTFVALDAFLPGYIVATGASANFYPPFRGGPYPISWTIDPTQNIMIWTNGVDPVQSFASGVNSPLAELVAIATTARLVIRFHGYTLAIGTTEDGQVLPYRVRYSTPVSSSDWTSFAAGYNDLADTADAITSVAIVAGYLILGRENSVMRGSYWGTALATFYWEYTLPATGLLGNHALENTRVSSLFVSDSGIFQYNGDYSLTLVGDNVYNYMLGVYGSLDPSNAQNLFLFYIQQLDEVWAFFPSVGHVHCDTVLRYSVKYNNWFVRKFNSEFADAGVVFKTASTRWIDMVGSWLGRAGNVWNQRANAGDFPLVILASYNDRVTYEYNYSTQTDAGSIIPWLCVTKDYPVLTEKLTLDGIRVYAKGSAFFEVSLDSGTSWYSLGTLFFGTNFTKQKLDYRITGDFFRFRISGNDPTFQLADLSIAYMDGSEF